MIRKVVIIALTLAALGTAGVWVASCTVVPPFLRDSNGVHAVGQTFWFNDGRGSWGWCAGDISRRSELKFMVVTKPSNSHAVREGSHGFAGFGWSRFVIPFQGGHWLTRSIYMPTWAPVVVFGTYPVLAFIRGPLRRWRRRRKGWCVHCGYNLTGNVSGVCPECGERI